MSHTANAANTRQRRPRRLSDLPLVAYQMRCGHLSKDYAIAQGDIVFCDSCQTYARVSTILAQ